MNLSTLLYSKIALSSIEQVRISLSSDLVVDLIGDRLAGGHSELTISHSQTIL